VPSPVGTGMDPYDFAPSCTATRRVVSALRDDQLTAPTPCRHYTVGDLVEHVGGLAAAFQYSARKEEPPGEMRDGDAAQLEDGWRERIADDLDALAVAWCDPAAYTGLALAGPVEMPGREVAHVALNEVVVHGWDLAIATGQTYQPDPAAVEVCRAWVESFDAPANDDGGLFGPPVTLGDGATPFEQLLALTGRDPRWTPPDGS